MHYTNTQRRGLDEQTWKPFACGSYLKPWEWTWSLRERVLGKKKGQVLRDISNWWGGGKGRTHKRTRWEKNP
jgi:hypothetical protein